MKNIVVIIRVFDRIEDLSYNLDIINRTWKSNTYETIVVSNGVQYGYKLNQDLVGRVNNVIELQYNAGHLKGSSQLLTEGIKIIDFCHYDYVVILEADTWIYGDSIVEKYISKMKRNKAVWASARWYDRFCSLATDFAIIDAKWLRNNKEIFDFTYFPECHMANYLNEHNSKYVYIKENMQTLIPSYIHFEWPYSRKGRFNCFPKGKMVTHHVEDYDTGFVIKKQEFNAIVGFRYFKDVPEIYLFWTKMRMKFSHFIQSVLPKRSWFGKRSYLNIDSYMEKVNSKNI